MLIGNKIKALRQQSQMSLESLAGLLSVSCEVLYQWEENISLPPMEYIYRMEEIFNTSFEEFFVYNSTVSVENPIEEHTFSYNANDVKSVHNFINLKFNASAIIVAIISSSLLVGYFISGEYYAFIGALVFTVIASIFYIVKFISNNKVLQETTALLTQSLFKYQFFSNYIKVTAFSNNCVSGEYVIKDIDLKQQWNTQDYIAFKMYNQLFIIKKQELMYNSYVYSFMNGVGAFHIKNKKTDKSFISILLCLASIIALFIPFLVIGSGNYEYDYQMLEEFWTFFLYTPIPIASIVYGIVQNCRGISNKKNIITGIIMLILFCLYGSYPFMMSELFFISVSSSVSNFM